MLKLTTKSLLRCLCMLLVLFLVQGFQVSAVHAGAITEIVVFGDSLSDTGNLFNFTQGVFPPLPPYYQGRFSNGPVWVEWLATRLGVDIPMPFYYSPSPGTNYACGGAMTGSGRTELGIPNIGEQIESFLDFLDQNGNKPTDSQLFVIWGGANDFIHATTLLNPDDVVNHIVDHIRTIAGEAEEGAELKFLVPNLPPLWLTPLARWLAANRDPNIDQYLNYLSTTFNDGLSIKLADLADELGITILQLDIFRLGEDIGENPAAFGFTNTMDTARIGKGPLGEPLSYEDGGSEVVENADEYVFFDDVHPTVAWHEIAGNLAFELVSQRFPEPIPIDIRPFSRLNLIVPWEWSFIPVAILSDDGFDAVDEVMRGSLTFGLTGEEKSLAFCYSHGQDVNSDGLDDLICVFRTEKAGFHCNDSEGILKGRTVDGTSVMGSDSVRMGLCR